MIEHIKIANPHKNLEWTELQNLGKINIICGQNNSGKSTILEAINKGSRDFGKTISFENWLLHIKESLEKIPDNRLKEAFKDQLRQKEIWYQQDYGKIIAFIRRNPRLKKLLQTIPSKLQNQFHKVILDESANIQLLLPKRQFSTTGTTKVVDVQNPSSGQEIISSIFHMKNQNPGTELLARYYSLKEGFKLVSSGFDFNIQTDPDGSLHLSFSKNSDEWQLAETFGLGLQDILVILFFALHDENDILLIEEPENHLHPDVQRKLLHFLKNNTDKQYIISTHSSVFLDTTIIDKVFFTYYDGEVKVDDASSRALILSDLGYSVTDNLVSDLIILTEGPTDKPVVERFLFEMGLSGKYAIKIWPLGGDNMEHVDLSVFTQQYKVIALIDKDPKSDKARKKFIVQCEKYNISVTKLKRYALENYFTLEALKKVFGAQIDDAITAINPDEKLESQIGMDVKKKNWNIAQEMTLEDIKGTDLYEFFEEVQRLLETS